MIYRDSPARLAVDDPTLEVALTFAREREGIDPDFGAGSTA